MSEKYTNGSYQQLAELHESRLDDLKNTVKEGFDGLKKELQLSREQGHIPVAIVLTLIKSISWPYVLVIIYLTGVKYIPELFAK